MHQSAPAPDPGGRHGEHEAREQHEPLGDERDDAGDRGRDGLAGGYVVHVQRVQQQCRDRNHERNQDPEQVVDGELQRRELAAILSRDARQLVRVGVCSDALGLVGAAAGDAEGSRLHAVAGAPGVRIGLAGEDRLVDLQAAGLEQPAIGHHLVSRAQHDRVPGDHVVDVDLALRTVAQDPRPRRREQRQAIERSLGPHLLDDPDARVDHQDRREEQIRELSRRDQGNRAGRQHEVEQREQIAADDRPVGHAAGRRVRGSPLEPARCLGRGETVRRHLATA